MLAVHCVLLPANRFLLRRFSSLESLGLDFAFRSHTPLLARCRTVPGTACVELTSLTTEDSRTQQLSVMWIPG